MSSCDGCHEPLPASMAVFTVTEFGPVGEPPTAIYALCSPECLRDLGIDLRTKEVPTC